MTSANPSTPQHSLLPKRAWPETRTLGRCVPVVQDGTGHGPLTRASSSGTGTLSWAEPRKDCRVQGWGWRETSHSVLPWRRTCPPPASDGPGNLHL